MKRIGDLAVLDEGEDHRYCSCTGFRIRRTCGGIKFPRLSAPASALSLPDLRGFGESAKTQEVEAYRLRNLLGDVVAVLDELGIERAAVVGHDWGAGLAWVAAGFAPDRVDRLVVTSVGHPARSPP